MIKNLYELYNLIEKVSTALPNVNQFVNSFDSLNREDTSYAAVVLQFRDGTQATEGSVRYRFYLGYVDRVNENTDTPSTSNNILTQSIAEENIRLIINKLYPEVDITFGNTFYPFTQRFTALTAGCYVELAITLAVKDCNYESGSVLRDVEIVSDSNGVKEVVPGAGIDGFKKVIVRTEVPLKEEVEKDIVITENGNTMLVPDTGQSFSKVNIDVNVSGGGSKYSYKVPTADTPGLKDIGWDDESVNYYKYNNYDYPTEANNYKVSDANKQIVINNMFDIENYKENPDFRYCPMFDMSVEDMANHMFADSESLTAIPLLDTQSVTDMNGMFSSCSSLTSIPQLNTSNVFDMAFIFEGCTSLTSIPQLDTSNVTEMTSIFYGCTALTSIPQLNTSNVTDMSNMFQECKSLTSIPQLDTHSVTGMNSMFAHCYSLTSIPQMDTHSVTDMEGMFAYCLSLTSIPRLDTSNVTTMYEMFYNCPSLTTLGGLTNLKLDLDLSTCPKLTHDSLMNVINEAADVTADPKTLTLGSTNLNKLTDEEKAIATNKGWTLA